MNEWIFSHQLCRHRQSRDQISCEMCEEKPNVNKIKIGIEGINEIRYIVSAFFCNICWALILSLYSCDETLRSQHSPPFYRMKIIRFYVWLETDRCDSDTEIWFQFEMMFLMKFPSKYTRLLWWTTLSIFFHTHSNDMLLLILQRRNWN